jgi:hypothetical protein
MAKVTFPNKVSNGGTTANGIMTSANANELKNTINTNDNILTAEIARAIAAEELKVDKSYVFNASVITYNSWTGYVFNSIGSRLKGQGLDIVSCGAISDSFSYSLAVYAGVTGINTLQKAKDAYGPHVDSMQRSVNWAAIQGLVNYVSAQALSKTIKIPMGTYNIGDETISVPNNVSFQGEGNFYCTIQSTKDVFKNADPDNFFEVSASGISVRAGVGYYGFKLDITTEAAYLNLSNFSFLSGHGIYCGGLFQCSNFDHVIFQDVDNALVVPNGTSNMNNFLKCDFRRVTGTSIYFRASVSNNFIGTRFEAGGVAGKTTIDVTDTSDMNFLGCYIENTHENFLRETGSTNSISIDGTHFTQSAVQIENENQQVKFISDGIIRFGTNTGFKKSKGSRRMFFYGENKWIDSEESTVYSKLTDRSAEFSSAQFPVPQIIVIDGQDVIAKDLLTITRAGADGSAGNRQVLKGKLTLICQHLGAGGFFSETIQEYDINVRGSGTAIMNGVYTKLDTVDEDPNFQIRTKVGATRDLLIIEGYWTGVNPVNPVASSNMVFGEFETYTTYQLTDRMNVTINV